MLRILSQAGSGGGGEGGKKGGLWRLIRGGRISRVIPGLGFSLAKLHLMKIGSGIKMLRSTLPLRTEPLLIMNNAYILILCELFC